MKRLAVLFTCAALAAALTSCAAKSDEDAASSSGAASGGGSAAPASASLPRGLDDGPRAADEPRDEAKAETGKGLFQTKGCSACHAFGKKVTGPDLAGVSQRRTVKWLEAQILHPDLMVKEDPIARQLFATHALQMPKQGLTPNEAKAVIEYFKQVDHEASQKH
jgi:mono/diheme cytochrome c family protein